MRCWNLMQNLRLLSCGCLPLRPSAHTREIAAYTSRVPTEITYIIIAQAWSFPLSIQERIHMMTALPLVNREWALIFYHISSKHIQIPCVSYYRHLLGTLTSKKSFIHHPKSIKAASNPCQSVSLMVDEEYTIKILLSNKPGPTEASTAFLLGGMGNFLPNLRTVNVLVRYPGYTGINVVPAGLSWGRIPAQVTDLNLHWEMGHRRSRNLTLPRHTHSWHTSTGSPFKRILRLSIRGARDARLIGSFVARCPRLETLQVEGRLEPCPEHQIGCTATLHIRSLGSDQVESHWEAHLVSEEHGLLTFRHVDSLYCEEDGEGEF